MNRQPDTPTYRLLPYAVFAFVVISFALQASSPFYTHHLADPDDYMRLDQVLSWLRGQSWYDLSVPRLSPFNVGGAPTVVHWSRLIDLPIAVLALPFAHAFGLKDAVMIAALIVPLIWFAVFLAVVTQLAGTVLGARAELACIFVLFAPLLLFNYTPGRVDHHGVQAIIALFGLLAFTRIAMNENGRRFAMSAAAVFACGFWIGAEALPWVIVFIAVLGIAAAWQGGAVARNAAWFGLALPLCTAALIPLALPASEFSSRALSWFSPAYALFAALSGGILIAGWGLGRLCAHRRIRLALYLLLAILAALGFFILIPSALHGPFADYDAFDATTALDNIAEAQPLIDKLHINFLMPMTILPVGITFLRLLALPLVAFLTCLWQARRERGAMRLIWLGYAVFLGASILLALFWQMRVGVFIEAFMLAPLARLLSNIWDRLAWKVWGRKLFWAEVGVFILLGPLPVLLIPAAYGHAPFYPDLALFPATRNPESCPLDAATLLLNDARLFGNKPLTILNTSDTGPELLYATRDNVVAGNFDVPGNQDVYQFFNAADDAQAQAAAARRGADLVLFCKNAPTLYLGRDYYALAHMQLQLEPDGKLHLRNTDHVQPLIARLTRSAIPVWLQQIEIPGDPDYLLFKIQKPIIKK